ncbi:MAG: hypothetical protein IIW72_05630, partial [Clostridia bacterium]|nr:hypothetical protein [Clostridia bacterium]
NVQFVVREYDEKGEFTKSIGAITNGSTYTPTKDFAYHISVAIWESGDTTSDLMGMLKAGEINPTIEMVAVKGVVSFAKPFVKTSAQFKMSNIKASATASTTFIESSATEVATAAKFIAKDCQFTASGTAQPLKFTANAIELDIQDSTIYSTTGNGLEISSSGVFGTIKNTKITKNSSNAFVISKTAPEGIVFDGVTASQGGWDSTASTISGGTVLLTGGTEISGSNMASTVLNISGGNVTLDGVKIYGDKGSDTNRRLINFASDGLKVQIKKAYFATGTANGAKGLITNDNARLFAALADDHAFYYEKTPSGEFAYTPDTNFKNLKVLYADICTHDAITADCDNPGECLYCLHQFDALGHDNLGWKVNDEGKHYKVCSRCELIDENYTPEAHFGGEAECDVQAKCEACGTYYGDVLGHDFTDKLCYDEAEHWIGCNREGGVARSEVEGHKGGKAECEAKAVCEVCKQEYGEVLGHSFIDYISNNDAGCTTNATETAECVHGCGNTDTRIVLNSSLGHNWEVMPEIPATCCKTGLTEGSKCSRCDIVKIEQEVIPKNANAHKWDNGKLTTQGDCAHDAIYTYTCELCKTTSDINFGKVTNKHTYSSTFTTDVKATYFKAGSKSKHCIHCDAKTSVTKIAKKKLKTPKLSVTAGTGKLTVKYKKVTGSTNYQVKYVVNGKTKTLTFKAKQKTAVIKKLKAGKYKVQIRAMVKSGSKKAYSSW